MADDPLSILARPLEPVDPGPEFTARLRTRLVDELRLSEENPAMAETAHPAETAPSETAPPTETTSPVVTGPRPGALPYLAVVGARAAIHFYGQAFGAVLIGDPYVMGDGRIGHAELAIGGGVIYLADEFPDIGVVAPRAGASVTLMIDVADTDQAVDRARAAGATVTREPSENYGTRNATIVDPFGHRWGLAGPLRGSVAADQIRPGDLIHLSWWTPDAERAARFYAAVLGWAYRTDHGPSRPVVGTSVSSSVQASEGTSTLFCVYAVNDLDAACGQVRAAGGAAEIPRDEPYGRVATCHDRGGLTFSLWQIQPGTSRPPINGSRTGDVCYVTYGVPSSRDFREFYGAVLGWTFAPGRVEDGWEPLDTAPMSGTHGGEDAAVIVPMWAVDDVETAVERVRAAGGTVIDEPSRAPYGMSAQCRDDQGGRFYLGET